MSIAPQYRSLIFQVGNMPKTDFDVGTGLVGAPACGEYVYFTSFSLLSFSPSASPGASTYVSCRLYLFSSAPN